MVYSLLTASAKYTTLKHSRNYVVNISYAVLGQYRLALKIVPMIDSTNYQSAHQRHDI